MDAWNALVLLVNFIVIPASTYGAQLALGALGITLVFKVLRFSNIAHGDTMAFTTMIALLITGVLKTQGVSIFPLPTVLLAIPLTIALTICTLLLIDRMVYRFYRQQKSSPITFMVASIGVMFILNGIVRMIIGPGNQTLNDGSRFIITAREFKTWTGLQEGLVIKTSQILTITFAGLAVSALFWFMRYTYTGKSMRAFSDNSELADLSGISSARVIAITWSLAAALTTLAGVLYGLDKSFSPFTYFQLLLPMFASAILGGYGHPIGAIAGGFTIAFSEITLTYGFKKFVNYLGNDSLAISNLLQLISTDYKFAISLVILIAILILKPSGFFGNQNT